MKIVLYSIIKNIVRVGLFFYTKKITIIGKENIPTNEAVLFVANHPNGLIDPLIIATSIRRKMFFLVRAAVFKNKHIASLLNLIGLMPVYRIRDGINQLGKNEAIFNQCKELLHNKQTLLIFPEGSHKDCRTIRPLSKGFTRIVFGALAKFPELKIHIVPVGLTYQKVTQYPSKITMIFGKPIVANSFFYPEDIHQSARLLKEEVANQLKNITVHINNDDTYNNTIKKLTDAKVDFTDVFKVKKMIENNHFPTKKASKSNPLNFLKWLIILNSFIPYILWKRISKKIKEVEFVDTFRFTVNLISFPIFYGFQSCVIAYFFGWKTAIIYFSISILSIIIYTKFSSTN